MPSAFRTVVEESGEEEVFVNSTDDRILKVYLLAAWHAWINKLLKAIKNDPLPRLFLMKADYNC